MPTQSELEVEKLLGDTLFEEFVHRSPMLSDGSKELADVLVLYRDVLLIFQVKMPDADAHAERSVEKRQGWVKKNREKALGQIGSTWRYIAAGKAESLENRRFPKQVLRADLIRSVVGIAVVGEAEDVDDPAELAITRAGRDIPVVTLTMQQLRRVLRAFDTVSDFVGAVQAMVRFGQRLEAIRKMKTQITSCLAALSSYVDANVTEDQVLYVMSNGQASRDVWQEFSAPGGVIDRRHEGMRASRLIDHIITRLHECADEYPRVRRWIGSEVLQREESSWYELAETLAGLNRGQREAYGAVLVQLMEASQSEDRTHGHSFQICAIDSVDWQVVLSASPGDAEARSQWIGLLVEVVRATRGFPRVLGIATELLTAPTRSFQFAWAEGEPIDLASVHPDLQPLVDYVRGLRILPPVPVLR